MQQQYQENVPIQQHQNHFQSKEQNYKKSLHENHFDLVNGINDANQISNFDCEWIDNQQSPHKYTTTSFPSQIQIGLDNIKIGSNHHLELNHIQFSQPVDSSFNERLNDSESDIKKFNNSGIHDKSDYLDKQESKSQQYNLLKQQLELLNNLKQHQYSFQKRSQKNQQSIIEIQHDSMHQAPLTQQQLQMKEIKNEEIVEVDLQAVNRNSSSIINEAELKSNPKEQQNQMTQSTLTKDIKQIDKQESHSKSSIQRSQITQTINENSVVSRLYQDLSSIQQSKILKSMATYLQTNHYSYHPFYSTLQHIFTSTKTESNKSLENFYMYADFFKEKFKQFQKYLRELTNQKTEQLYQSLKIKEINNLVYVDTKIILRDIHQRNVKKAKLYKQFYKELSEINKQLRETLSKVYSKRSQLQKQISFTLRIIKDLQSQIQKFIEYRLDYEKNKNSANFDSIEKLKNIFKADNAHIYKDHYLQIKYIIQKQHLYIQKLKSFRKECFKYFNEVYSVDDILISTKIKEYLINYTEALIQLEKQEEKIYQKALETQQKRSKLNEKKDSLTNRKIQDQLKYQMTQKLVKSLPQKLREQLGIQFKTEVSSQQVLEKVFQHFQNEVFMSNIEMEDEFVFFKNQGIWIPQGQYKNFQNEQKNITSPQKIETDKVKNKQIMIVVLTVNKYLHMEIGNKIASMKLSQIKISKKGKYLIITDRGKGFVGYLVHSGNQLGRIELKSNEEAQQFAIKIKDLIENK